MHREVIEDEDLKNLVKIDPFQTVRGNVKEIGVSHNAVINGLRHIGKVKKKTRKMGAIYIE